MWKGTALNWKVPGAWKSIIFTKWIVQHTKNLGWITFKYSRLFPYNLFFLSNVISTTTTLNFSRFVLKWQAHSIQNLQVV